MKKRILAYCLFGLVMLVWMREWRGSVIPLTPREENVLELSNIWSLYSSAQNGSLFTKWNPQLLGGHTNFLQRSYLFFSAPIAVLAFVTNVSIEGVYKVVGWLLFAISGIGMYEYLRKVKLSQYGAIVGGLIYMLLPPHLILGIDFLDFNLYWTLVPWLGVVVEKYVNNRRPISYGAVFGLLLAVGLIAGSSYFAATAPFFLLYFWWRIVISGKHKRKTNLLFLLSALLFFVSLTAYLILPVIFESKYMWVYQESQRKKIFNILSFKEIGELLWLRLKGVTASSWRFNRNHPDFAFYLSWPTLLLASFGAISFRKWRVISLPVLFLIVIFLGFVSLRLSVVHQALLTLTNANMRFSPSLKLLSVIIFIAIIVYVIRKTTRARTKSLLISLLLAGLLLAGVVFNINKLQALYDHTHRIFILVTFSLAVLAAVGTEKIRRSRTGFKRVIFLVFIGALLVIDLHPFSVFFKSTSFRSGLEGVNAYKAIDEAVGKGRYWSPFPYAPHLPLYNLEYPTRAVSRLRLNNENLYTPFTPRYSTELFDVMLIGGLEREQVAISDVLNILEWGYANFVVFRPQIFDYEKVIEVMKTQGWEILYEDTESIAIENGSPSSFITLYSRFNKVPSSEIDNLEYWLDNADDGAALYDDEIESLPNYVIDSQTIQGGEVLSWQRLSPTEISSTIDVSASTLVAASEAWYPGWRAEIDGVMQPVVRANYAFLGVFVEPGSHSVRFYYNQPWYYLVGKLLSFMGVVALLLTIRAMFFTRRTSRRLD